MMTHQDIYDVLDRRRIELGLSQADASFLICGRKDSSFFQGIRKGSIPSASRLEAASKALGLEFYFGPPRGEVAPPPEAVPMTADQSGAPDLLPEIAAHMKAARDELARVESIQANLMKRQSAALEDTTALALEVANDDTEPVNIMNLAGAAGAGAEADNERVKGQRWFQRDWLVKRGLHAKSCAVIGVRGESMEPTLPDGCSILVNRASRDLRDGHIFLLRGGNGLIVKRAAEDADGWRLVSDHPSWEDIPWSPAEFEIIGQVVWMARSLV